MLGHGGTPFLACSGRHRSKRGGLKVNCTDLFCQFSLSDTRWSKKVQ
ncbi:hypothetical protein JL2886_02226 [Phaeobacter gallaeciensis]|uniref:Uncharacterized protein n=1 Tax=Phaeobacter gallaeciensis TaxID=60890 RepID=A0A1B0ZSE0_9RHOB|nr:hypothetical protein JL2886_02226 [Phaeobacter gallaeciensis]